MSASKLQESMKDPVIRGQYLAELRDRTKDVLVGDITAVIDSLIEVAVTLEAAERERDELRERLSLVRKKRDAELNKNTQLEAELARRDAAAGEPYGYVHKSLYEAVGSTGLSNDHEAYRDSPTHIALYTAAQPAALPPEMKPEPEKYDVIDHGFIAGYNQCRADAMALGAQQQKVVALPDIAECCLSPAWCSIAMQQITAALDAAGVKWEVKK